MTVRASLLEWVSEQACEDRWRNIGDDLRQLELAHSSRPGGTERRLTEPAAPEAKRLKRFRSEPCPGCRKSAAPPRHG